ncbi:MAG: hypothetical protein EOP49_31240 [Sphingobacteriales bacterium]|nr:MAG: hypothetical protein EOP49_31240 [Sphingobacteriales bacterium]
MTITEIIQQYHQTGHVPPDMAQNLEANQELRVALVQHFREHPDRHFALALMKQFTKMRLDPEVSIGGEELMLAVYILGLHGQVEDCQLIWEAKRSDFDAYCMVDIELMAFAGAEQTIA